MVKGKKRKKRRKKKKKAFIVSMTVEAFFVGACKMGVLFLLRFLMTCVFFGL